MEERLKAKADIATRSSDPSAAVASQVVPHASVEQVVVDTQVGESVLKEEQNDPAVHAT